MNGFNSQMRPQMPRMGKAVRTLLIILFGTHILFLMVVSKKIFGADAAIWVLENLRLHSPDGGPLDGKLWQVGTYMWFHDVGLSHLLFNLLILFFFGPLFERSWGLKDFVRFFVLCGIGAGVVQTFFSWLSPTDFGTIVIGSSGAMLGLIVAFGMRFPNQEVLLFFVLPIAGRYIVWLTIAIDLLVFLSSDSDVAIAAHWGGMLTAYLLISGNWRLSRLKSSVSGLFGRGLLRIMGKKKKKKRKFNVVDGGRGPWLH